MNPELDERAALLQDAARRVDGCRRCAIGSQRRHAVFGEGNPYAELLLIGEAPGESEDASARPFIGRSGKLLEKMLATISLRREDVFITSIVKCRPTLPGPRGLKNRAPDAREIAHCRSYLDEQVEILQPRVILALGSLAAKSFLGKQTMISKERGNWSQGPLGIPLMVTFHPAYLLRQTGGEIEAVKRLVGPDLHAVRAKLDEPSSNKSERPVGIHAKIRG